MSVVHLIIQQHILRVITHYRWRFTACSHYPIATPDMAGSKVLMLALVRTSGSMLSEVSNNAGVWGFWGHAHRAGIAIPVPLTVIRLNTYIGIQVKTTDRFC